MVSDVDVAFELYVSRFYKNKANNARRDGYEFGLSLISVRNLLMAKRCYYTGREMTLPNYRQDGSVPGNVPQRPTDVTIDRVDNSLGYVKGNVVACCKAANSFKARLDNDNFELGMDDMIRMSDKLKKRVK